MNLLGERIPVLEDEMLGGQYFQPAYEQGLVVLREFYKTYVTGMCRMHALPTEDT